MPIKNPPKRRPTRKPLPQPKRGGQPKRIGRKPRTLR